MGKPFDRSIETQNRNISNGQVDMTNPTVLRLDVLVKSLMLLKDRLIQSDRFNLLKGHQTVKNGRASALKKRFDDAFASGSTKPAHPKNYYYYWATDSDLLDHIWVTFEEPDYHPLCFAQKLFYY